MPMIRKLIPVDVTELGEDEVEVVMSTASLARDGHVLVPQGARLENYRANPIVLWGHDANKPVGNSEDVTVEADRITARVRFAPLGISAQADETRGLVKAGVVRAVSISFDPLDGEPLDRAKPKGGQRFTEWDLLELSFVSVPSDTGAVVTARAHGDDPMPDATEPAAAPEAKPAPRRTRTREHRTHRAARVTLSRGIYDIGSLCYVFSSLGYAVDNAKFEAAIEGDGSAVPGMLVGVLHDLGEALIAMTQEEVAEALAHHDVEVEDDEDDEVLTIEERAHIRAASAPLVRAFRRGLAHAKQRAGKTLSAETVRCLREAKDLHEEAIGLCRSAIAKHKDGLAAVDDMLDRAGASDETDTTQVQTSDGVDESDGSANSRSADNLDWRRRQVDLMAFSAV